MYPWCTRSILLSEQKLKLAKTRISRSELQTTLDGNWPHLWSEHSLVLLFINIQEYKDFFNSFSQHLFSHETVVQLCLECRWHFDKQEEPFRKRRGWMSGIPHQLSSLKVHTIEQWGESNPKHLSCVFYMHSLFVLVQGKTLARLREGVFREEDVSIHALVL